MIMLKNGIRLNIGEMNEASLRIKLAFFDIIHFVKVLGSLIIGDF